MQDEEAASAQDRALLRVQAVLLAATVTALVMATAYNEASVRLACTALAITPC
jgi:hypothetical protein